MLRIQRPSPPAVLSSPASATTAGSSPQDGLPVSLQPPLAQGQSRQIPFAYLVPLHGQTIFLEPQDWFPSFLPPRGPFATSQARAPKTEIHIYAPPQDRVLTTGRLRRVNAAPPGQDAEYVYEIGSKDFPPFLLIGRYQEQRVRARGQRVLFWTRRLFDSGCAQSVANQAVATVQLYRSLFGRLREHLGPLRIIEFPSGGYAPASGSTPGTGTVPNGALFSEDPAEACRQGNSLYFQLARNLAATWFGWAVRPAPGAAAILGSGVQDYAALVAEEKRESPQVRRRQVALWIAEYDRLSSQSQPLPPRDLGSHPAGDQFRMAGVQSALFFVALEDRLGAEPVQRALGHLVRSLDGSTSGLDELRSALEGESGENLYDFFNQWLGRAGIPSAFRRRYSGQGLKSDIDENAVKRSRREEE